jgi:hypothetical protein|tara:strand:- start:4415 stop:4516 length:102 start_codon:yes stop_codon:yes gene_type:complete
MQMRLIAILLTTATLLPCIGCDKEPDAAEDAEA